MENVHVVYCSESKLNAYFVRSFHFLLNFTLLNSVGSLRLKMKNLGVEKLVSNISQMYLIKHRLLFISINLFHDKMKRNHFHKASFEN